MSLMTGLYEPVTETGEWSNNSFFVQPGGYAVTVAEIHQKADGWWGVYWFGYATISKGINLGSWPTRDAAVAHVEGIARYDTVLAP